MGFGIGAGAFADGFVRGMGLARQKQEWEERQQERENKKKADIATAQAMDNAMQEVRPHEDPAQSLEDPEFGLEAAYGKQGRSYGRGLHKDVGDRTTPDMDRLLRERVGIAGTYTPDALPGVLNEMSAHQRTQALDARHDKERGEDLAHRDKVFAEGQKNSAFTRGIQGAQERRAAEKFGIEKQDALLARGREHAGIVARLLDEGSMDAANTYVQQYGGEIGGAMGLPAHRRVVGIDPGPDGRFALRVQNAKTGTVGPMTERGSKDAQDKVVYFTKEQLRTLSGATGQGKPTDTAKKYNEMLAIGVPDTVARGVAYGTYMTVTDPATGATVVVDLVTNKEVGSLAPEDPEDFESRFVWKSSMPEQGGGKGGKGKGIAGNGAKLTREQVLEQANAAIAAGADPAAVAKRAKELGVNLVIK